MAPSHFKDTSLERLIALITKSNPKLSEWEYGIDYNLGEASAIVTTSFRNTGVKFTPTNEEFREQTLRYRRFGLEILRQFEDDMEDVVIPRLPCTTHEILDEINEKLGLALLPEEVENITYTTFSTRYPLRIATARSSLGWTKSAYSFKARLAGRFRRTSQGGIRVTDKQVPRAVSVPDTEG